MPYSRRHYRLTAHPPQRWADRAGRVFLGQPPRVNFPPEPGPNPGVQATAASLRSCVAVVSVFQSHHHLDRIYRHLTTGTATPKDGRMQRASTTATDHMANDGHATVPTADIASHHSSNTLVGNRPSTGLLPGMPLYLPQRRLCLPTARGST